MPSHSKHEILADRVTAQVAKDLSKRYGLKVVGSGGSVHEDVKKLALSFSYYGEMSQDEYRQLIVNCAEYYLGKINSEEELKPHLHNYPFDSKNIELSIFIFDENKKRLEVGELSCVYVINGKVVFSFRDSEYTVDTEHEEPYEEALRIVRDQHELKEF